MKNIDKSIFLNSVNLCTAFGWLLRNGKVDLKAKEKISDKFQKEQGIEVGKKARLNFPQGILIDNSNIARAVEETKKLMMDGNVQVIFETVFLADNLAAKADILRRTDKGWYITEVN